MSRWLPAHVAGIATDPGDAIPAIGPADLARMAPGVDVWDIGPVRTPAGDPARPGGRGLWLALSAPAEGDPGGRHDIARLRLVAGDPGTWDDLGPLFPDGAALGSREWAASATLDEDAGTLDVLYTATGGRGGSLPHFTQRIVATRARAAAEGGRLRWGGWSAHEEVLGADGAVYARTDADDGEPGFIKAFRDPFPVRDPGDGTEWVVFAASAADSADPFDGAVGVACRGADGAWRLAPPVLRADGVNTELERPHLVHHGGAWYLFISTQARTFAPGLVAPTGLYGFVAPAVGGPYTPLNGSGLVLRNPAEAPFQAYSWWVLPDLSVVAFADLLPWAPRGFGGVPAPMRRLWIDGDRAGLAA